MKTVPIYITDSLYERIARLARHDNTNWLRAVVQVLEAGCDAVESQHEQADRVCCRCQNADGEEESAHGGRWYCRPCWRFVTHKEEEEQYPSPLPGRERPDLLCRKAVEWRTAGYSEDEIDSGLESLAAELDGRENSPMREKDR